MTKWDQFYVVIGNNIIKLFYSFTLWVMLQMKRATQTPKLLQCFQGFDQRECEF